MITFNPEELAEIAEFNSSPDNPLPKLTEDELNVLRTGMGLTLKLAVKGRRLLDEHQLQTRGDSRVLYKRDTVYFASRQELYGVVEEMEEQMRSFYLLFATLKRKGLLSEEDLQQTVADLAKEITSGDDS